MGTAEGSLEVVGEHPTVEKEGGQGIKEALEGALKEVEISGTQEITQIQKMAEVEGALDQGSRAHRLGEEQVGQVRELQERAEEHIAEVGEADIRALAEMLAPRIENAEAREKLPEEIRSFLESAPGQLERLKPKKTMMLTHEANIRFGNRKIDKVLGELKKHQGIEMLGVAKGADLPQDVDALMVEVSQEAAKDPEFLRKFEEGRARGIKMVPVQVDRLAGKGGWDWVAGTPFVQAMSSESWANFNQIDDYFLHLNVDDYPNDPLTAMRIRDAQQVFGDLVCAIRPEEKVLARKDLEAEAGRLKPLLRQYVPGASEQDAELLAHTFLDRQIEEKESARAGIMFSHARADIDTVSAGEGFNPNLAYQDAAILDDLFRNEKVKVYRDLNNIRPGDKWSDKLEEIMGKSQMNLLMLTRQSIMSSVTLREVEKMRAEGKTVIAVLQETIPPEEEANFNYARLKAAVGDNLIDGRDLMNPRFAANLVLGDWRFFTPDEIQAKKDVDPDFKVKVEDMEERIRESNEKIKGKIRTAIEAAINS